MVFELVAQRAGEMVETTELEMAEKWVELTVGCLAFSLVDSTGLLMDEKEVAQKVDSMGIGEVVWMVAMMESAVAAERVATSVLT